MPVHIAFLILYSVFLSACTPPRMTSVSQWYFNQGTFGVSKDELKEKKFSEANY